MTDPRAAKIIDDLLVFSGLLNEDYNFVQAAKAYINAARIEHGVPVTLSLVLKMKSEGYTAFVDEPMGERRRR
jgi:hypothetical protein